MSHLTLAPDLSLAPGGSSGGGQAAAEWGVIPWPDVDLPDSLSFDHQPELATHPGPSPSLILQVLILPSPKSLLGQLILWCE